MKFSNNDDVLYGSTKLFSPLKDVSELFKNGKNYSESEMFRKTGFPVYVNEPLKGYKFKWGRFFEYVAPIEGDESNNCVIWSFCFDDLLKLYHLNGYFQDDLRQYIFSLFTTRISRPYFMDIIPDFITVVEGSEFSTIAFIVFETPENNFSDIKMAREWFDLAPVFRIP